VRYLFLLCLCLAACTMKKKTERSSLLVHAHRGARGFFPENTLSAFKGAADLGAPAIELDVVVSADSQVVVSHEPWMHADLCSTPGGLPVRRGRQHNLFKMTYAEIIRYDCGKRGNKKFPRQKKTAEIKPLLRTVIEEMERYTKEKNLPPIIYNIEIKCLAPGDGKYHPKPARFAQLVHEVVAPFRINERILIQSFDLRVLREMHKLDSSLRIGVLAMRPSSVKRRVKTLGFTPFMYNPNHKWASKKLIDEAHALGIQVHPYTVNDPAEMKKLIARGVDGLITDYPDRALKIMR